RTLVNDISTVGLTRPATNAVSGKRTAALPDRVQPSASTRRLSSFNAVSMVICSALGLNKPIIGTDRSTAGLYVTYVRVALIGSSRYVPCCAFCTCPSVRCQLTDSPSADHSYALT